MISVVVCSVNAALAEQLKRNIDETIGVPWEFILIDNNKLKKSITHVYNLGAARATFDLICFVHEDVIFRTKGWGRLVLNCFSENTNLGALGLAGTKYKSKAPSGWWTGIQSMDCCRYWNLDENGADLLINLNPDPSVKLQQVACIDGVFMCTRKSICTDVRFNEELDGFHFYDIDFSVAVSANYVCAVTFNIDLLHLTRYGKYDKIWVKYALQWHASHSYRLPVNTGAFTELRKFERRITRTWLYRLRFEKLGTAARLRWILASGSWKDPAQWIHIMVFIFPRVARTIAQIFRKSQ